MKSESFSFYYDILQLAAGSVIPKPPGQTFVATYQPVEKNY